MTNLNSLPKDIYNLLDTGYEDPSNKAFDDFGRSMADLLKRRLSQDEINRPGDKLRMSNFGSPCDRKLWYTVNEPGKKEKLNPVVRFKFLYGDIIEELVLHLAKLSGHDVKGQQDELEIEGVKGHRDAIIDGVLVDVKSANSRSFDKFKNHKLEDDDPFGYIHQLGLYLEASKDDPDLAVKGEAAFVAVDKELGHIVVDKYRKPPVDYHKEVREKKELLAREEPPKRRFPAEADGKSGNYKLGTQCSYCDFKKHCWRDSNDGQGVRTFLYSGGPRFLVKVARPPNDGVVEITEGKNGIS